MSSDMRSKNPHFKADTHLAGDRPLAGHTVTAPSGLRYKPVDLGSANVAMNEPRASNAAIRTYRSTKNSFIHTSHTKWRTEELTCNYSI